MQPTPHEVWATYSVKDHCESRALITANKALTGRRRH